MGERSAVVCLLCCVLCVGVPLNPLVSFDVADFLVTKAPSTTRRARRFEGGCPPRVLIGWPFPLGFGLDGRLLLARRGRVCV